jgi:hypothetical protein
MLHHNYRRDSTLHYLQTSLTSHPIEDDVFKIPDSRFLGSIPEYFGLYLVLPRAKCPPMDVYFRPAQPGADGVCRVRQWHTLASEDQPTDTLPG